MAIQLVQFVECKIVQTMLRGCDSLEYDVSRVHLTRQQKMCFVWKPDIVKELISSTFFEIKGFSKYRLIFLQFV